jgi:signal transduction histidine kinase
VGFVAFFGLLATLGGAYQLGRSPWPSALLVVLSAGALWWRRRYPRAVLLFVVSVEAVNGIFLASDAPSGLSLAFAAFAVSAYDRSPFRRFVAVAAIVIALTGIGLLLFGRFPVANHIIPSGVLSLVAWMAGDYVRSRRNFFLETVQRHQQAREQAADAERLRIARELHDVVAHNVSLMAIQAGAARVSGNSPQDALANIEQEARDTLAELNKLLGVLRKNPDSPGLEPQPSLDNMDALLKPAREAGLDATLKVEGARRPLTSALDLSAYRIVQEAITNVLKHAGATRVEVVVDYEPGALIVTVSDNGSGAQNGAASTGHGLIGMRERVELFGGDLTTGSSSLGGFRVRATLPVKS